MTTSISTTTDHLPEWFDPFPEPRTIPDGWDLSNLAEAERTLPPARKNATREDGDGLRAQV